MAADVHPDAETVAAGHLKERQVEEVAARLAQQDQEEQEILTCRLVTKHTQAQSCTLTHNSYEITAKIMLSYCVIVV